jgi:hypothetical protein
MKTDELIARLAASGGQVDRAAARRRFWAPLIAAIAVSIALVGTLMGPRPDWREAITLPMFWLKLAFPAITAAMAVVLLRRLGQPGRPLGAALLGPVLPTAMVWLMAAAALAAAPGDQRATLVLGSSWQLCITSIPLLSIPALALSFMAIRSLAPTRLMLAGAVAGLVGGSAAAFAYALHCPEMRAPFLAVWYVLGMVIPALAGACLGPRLLRW